ncbi:MAG: M16 family metallopeptidase [Gemmatimonadaceae bacterium]
MTRECGVESGESRFGIRNAIVLCALLSLACARRPTAEEMPTPVMQPAAVPTDTPRVSSLDRSRPPTLGAPPDLTLPVMARTTLPNGLQLVIVEQHELPVADFILLVRTGGEGDPARKAGVASLMAAMLQEGTTSRASLDIADQEAYLGARIQTGSGWDATSVALHTPTAQLDSALALFADVALRPSWPANELARLRDERMTSLMQIRDRPPAIADRAFASILYGGEHPYGRPLTGTEASTKALRCADLQHFYSTYFRPNNATMIIVGDVSAGDITQRVEALFGKWLAGKVPNVAFREPGLPAATTVYLIDKPGASQSSVRIGAVGVPRSTNDYFALLVMNTVLGGSFTSRLNANLRETKGYTYGANSRFDMRRAAGPFTARAEVTGGKTDSSLIEFMKELRAIRDTVPASELEKAKRYLQLGLPARFESTADIASQIIPVVLYDLPADYFNTYVRRIEDVTQADVQRVANRYLDPARMSIVIVGDRKSIEPGLKGLGMGAVVIRDLSGQPVRR